jgi:hypothetical protein
MVTAISIVISEVLLLERFPQLLLKTLLVLNDGMGTRLRHNVIVI